MNLTDEQKHVLRIAVAEIAGWKFVRLSTYNDKRPVYQHPNTGACATELPDYPEDLNAVHEVVHQAIILPFSSPANDQMDAAMIFAANLDKYEKSLESMLVLMGMCRIWTATALQRCIALVMTLAPEKWDAIKAMGKEAA